MGFRPLFTGLGVVGGYLAALLGLSFYVRRRIGARLWRKAHRATVVVYLLGLVHAFGAGTDASAVWFRWWVLMTAPGDRRPLRLPGLSGGAKRARSRDRAHEGARDRASPLQPPTSAGPRFPDPQFPRRHDERPRSSDRRRRPRGAALRRDAAPPRLRGAGADRLRRARPALRPPAALQGAAGGDGRGGVGRLPPGLVVRGEAGRAAARRPRRAPRPGRPHGRRSTPAPSCPTRSC